MIKVVLFDYGGTLVRPRKPWDSMKVNALYSVYANLSQHGLQLPYDRYVEFNDLVFQKYTKLEADQNRDVADVVKYQELVDFIFPARSKVWRERIAHEANDAFWDVAVSNYVLRKHVRESLDELRSMKLHMAVVSNHHNHQSLVKHLRHLGISSYFSRVISSARVGVRKPDPRIFEKSLSLMHARRQQAIFVGDSLKYDVEGARRVGMCTILVADDSSTGGENPAADETVPDFMVHDFREIPRIISSL